MGFLRRDNIALGFKRKQAGHVVYSRARYEERRVIYKENKHNKPELSRFETAFGGLARLFLADDLVPKQDLVKTDQDEITGLVCEHLSTTIARRERYQESTPTFYTIHSMKGERTLPAVQAFTQALKEKKPEQEEDIPFYFFNQFPPDFFKTLRQEADKGHIHLDMESLANVLTTSYTLEEDDLHRGNFGFYVVQKDEKPHVVFCKIDHDLMMADSVMSFCNARFLNWFNGSDAFQITARDLQKFPFLQDSQNYYWPTTKRAITPYKHAYTSDAEREAFADLANSPEFCEAKWLAFYQHVLTPISIIRKTLSEHLDENNPDERAEIALITQSIAARQAKLRAVLFTIPEFREFVYSLTDEKADALIQNIGPHSSEEAEEIRAIMKHHRELCQSGFEEGDTPLHVAIRLQDYRYHETSQAFRSFLNQTNNTGQTPLDIAVAMMEKASSDEKTTDVRAHLACTMSHLLHEGAEETPSYKNYCQSHPNISKDYVFDEGQYLEESRQVQNNDKLKELLRNISENHHYSLKMQKELSVKCMREYINHHRKDEAFQKTLLNFKRDLNSKPPAPELKFIHQLRSQLWIVRIIRGLYGNTSTKKELNRLIDQELHRLSRQASREPTFFKSIKKQEDSQAHHNTLQIIIHHPPIRQGEIGLNVRGSHYFFDG